MPFPTDTKNVSNCVNIFLKNGTITANPFTIFGPQGSIYEYTTDS